jgi:DNA-binding NarL/FixJ family response regulator
MPDILVASDSEPLRNEVRAAIEEPDVQIRELTRGAQVLAAVRERTPDLAVLDLQIGKMGAMAVCLDLRLEEGAERLPHVPVLMLLDRRADVFLARRSQVEGFVVKPLDPMRLARAIRTVLEGGTFYDEACRPVTISGAVPDDDVRPEPMTPMP